MRTSILGSYYSKIAIHWTGAALCLSSIACVGVQGGSDALTARFSGISTAVAVSPSAVTLTWPSQAGYKSYSIYSSTQDTPVTTLPTGTTYTVLGLKPNSTYSFSVVGTAADGNQYGVGKQLQATTWSNFLGPVSASAIDSQSIALLWNYNAGPAFNVYVSTGSAPTIVAGSPPKLLPPQYSSSSQSGYAVGGLLANTTYYFMVAAKYSDGTDSYQVSQGASSLATATYINSGTLNSLPVITTSGNLTTLVPPIFMVSGAQSTYQTKFELFNSDGSKTLLGNLSGSGSLTSALTLPVGVQAVLATVTDLFTGKVAYSEFSSLIVSTSLPNNGLRVVSATTPSALSPLPTITTNPISLGPFPIFTVSGGQPGYVTTIRNGTTILGVITGNGTIKTASSAPLPQGANSLTATVTYNGQSSTINGINVRVKSTDAQPVLAPVAVNGGIGLQGFGTAMVVGDFNCDGRPDLAVSGAYGTGGVWVYYGSAAGLDFSAKPSANPLPGKPLYLSGAAYVVQGYAFGETGDNAGFGASLAVGNFNGDFNLTATHPCSDLVITAPSASSPGGSGGFFTIYYGSPSGIQTGPLATDSFACLGDGSSSCQPTMYPYFETGIPPGPAYGGQSYSAGMTWAVATGDIDGDGYDDIVASAPFFGPNGNTETGIILMWRGSANGLSPNFTPIQFPANLTQNTGADAPNLMGLQLAIGHFMTSPRLAPGTPLGTLPNGPADVAISFKRLGADSIGIANPTAQSGIIVVPGLASSPYIDMNPVSHVVNNTYALILPPSCNSTTVAWGSQAGYGGCASMPQSLLAADVNQDGYDDLVFSDPLAYPPGGGQGAVYVYYGMAGMAKLRNEGNQGVTPTVGATCTDPTNNAFCMPQLIYRTGTTYFGSTLSFLGDINNDGFPDIGIGASGTTVGAATNAGLAYNYRGSASGLSTSFSTTINPNKPLNSFFGTTMAGANFSSLTGFADLQNGAHTFADVVVGAIGESPANRTPAGTVAPTGNGPLGSQGQGTATFFHNTSPGFPALLNAATAVLAPDNTLPSGLNSNVAVLTGDINGDGFGDVVISTYVPGPFYRYGWAWGAHRLYTTAPDVQEGFVIYYGSPTGFITTRLVGGVNTVIVPSYNPVNPTDPLFVTNYLLNGKPAFNDPYFAYGLGAPGDMNGDGYADVFTTSASQSVLFYGSPTGLIVAPAPQKIAYTSATRPSLDPTILGTSSGAKTFNSSGDFNGDGYSDIVTGDSASGYMVIYGSKWGPVTEGNITAPGTLPDQYSFTPNCVTVAGNSYCTPLVISLTAIVPTDPLSYISGMMTGGDMDGDGTDDLVAIIWGDNRFVPADAGTITIFYGSKNHGIDPNIQVNLQVDPVGPWRYWGSNSGSYLATYARAYDLNGDGLGDIMINSWNENYMNVIYGVPGSGTSPTPSSGAYVNQGLCTGGAGAQHYPCTVHVTALATTPGSADFQPNHILTVDANNPSSCNPALRACNVMRWALPPSIGWGCYALQGILGLGDITGDAYGDVVISRACAVSNGIAGNGTFLIYSGSASGLQVVGTPTYKPNCTGGVCDPTQFDVPFSAPQIPIGIGEGWIAQSYQNPSDVDGDGKRDFLISPSRSYSIPSSTLNSVDLSGNLNGINVGGFFLFH